MLKRSFLSAFVACCLALGAALPVSAQNLDDIVSIEVVPGWRTESGTHMAGFRIRLAPGWKTYWRAPGDAGIPPLFDWTGSENLAAAAFHWPVPEVSWQNGMRSIGYSEELNLPVELTLAEPGADARMTGRVQIGICESVCVPVELQFSATLPAQGGSRAPAIVAALIDRPMTASEAGIGGFRCALTPTDDGLHIAATVDLPATYQAAAAVIETDDPEVWVSEPAVSAAGGTMEATATLVHVSGGTFAVDRSALRLTVLLDDGGAIDIRGCTAG